ncbi:MAG: ABC transporter permease [Nitrospira sp.]|nr:ABC transporter permease [Nitrospira sp.]
MTFEAGSLSQQDVEKARGHGAILPSPMASIVHIKPSSGWVPLDVRELWEYRELLSFLAWRDVKVRYKQTVLGLAWALVKPLSIVFTFSIVFGWLARIPSDNIPYPLFSLCAVLPWQLFAHTLTGTSQSLVADQNLVTKAYFPRLVIPLSAIASGLVDFIVAAGTLAGLMAYFHVMPTLFVLTMPLFVLLGITTALGVGLWCAALNVRYRDVGHALPFVTQVWFFATPIAYPSSLIPESWRVWYGLNPMASVVEGIRWALLGSESLSLGMLLTSLAVALSVLVTGLYYFRRMEQTFADVV